MEDIIEFIFFMIFNIAFAPVYYKIVCFIYEFWKARSNS